MIENSFFTRQTGIIDPNNLTKQIGIIGAGSIGSWTTLALLKLGCQKVRVYDFDTIEEGNVGSQVYTSRDLGKPKLQALAEKMQQLTEGQIETENTRIDTDHVPATLLLNDIIILAVDNIETRKLVFNLIPKNWNGTLIDARMAGNAIEIYTVQFSHSNGQQVTFDTESTTAYEKTLFSPEQAVPVRCSERSVVYNVFIVAGLITDLVTKIVKGQSTPKELVMDLENLTLYGTND